MSNAIEEIEAVKDVGYLLIRLKLAKQKNETEVQDAVVNRLKRLGLLKDGNEAVETPFKNLRASVNKILGAETPQDAGTPSERTVGTTSA